MKHGFSRIGRKGSQRVNESVGQSSCARRSERPAEQGPALHENTKRTQFRTAFLPNKPILPNEPIENHKDTKGTKGGRAEQRVFSPNEPKLGLGALGVFVVPP